MPPLGNRNRIANAIKATLPAGATVPNGDMLVFPLTEHVSKEIGNALLQDSETPSVPPECQCCDDSAETSEAPPSGEG